MILTAEQQWMVAMAYAKAAADTLSVLTPQRAAFARKAARFRALARIAAKIEATAVVKEAQPLKPRQTSAAHESIASWEWRPQAKWQTLAERLDAAKAARGLLSER